MTNFSRPVGQYKRWQYAVLLFILGSLFISALPNFIQQDDAIRITTNKSQKNLLDHNQIINTLARHNIAISRIIDNSTGIQFTLKRTEDNTKTLSLLNTTLTNDYSVQLVQQSDRPQWFEYILGQPIKLGLDLSGGVLFVLDVDLTSAKNERIKQLAVELKLIALSVKWRPIRIVHRDDNSLFINTMGSTEEKISLFRHKLSSAFPNLQISQADTDTLLIKYNDQQSLLYDRQTMDHTLKTMRGRIEELGITEAVTQRQGKNRIRIELPGVHDPEEAKRIIGATASLDFYQMAITSSPSVKRIKNQQTGQLILLDAKPIFSGTHIINANAGRDQFGMPLVNLMLDNTGGKKMSKFSQENIGQPLVTVYSEYYRDSNNSLKKNSKVLSVASIQAHLSAKFSLTNLSSIQTAQELSLILRAGSLTAPVSIVKQRTIEASLGNENIKNGLKAVTVGLAITFIFMLFYYRLLGMIANISLLLNLVCLLGLMSLLPGAVLTLPGIAGLVLTVGMAVDTNVIIFEKIKEQLRRGLGLSLAIDSGYKNALSTILDANITTLLTAIILYSIGYGPIKGFALTLSLGILTSIFTGVFISKALTFLFVARNSKQLMGVSL